MATNNSVNTGLAGATGSGNFVGANTPTLITPNVGVATATSLVFSPTTSGIIGAADASSAGAGKVGEVITANNGVAVTFTLASTPYDICSISLSAGDWDIFGNISFACAAAQLIAAWTSTTSASIPSAFQINQIQTAGVFQFNGVNLPTPYFRVNTASPVTVYLTGYVNFNSSTTAIGFLSARRAR